MRRVLPPERIPGFPGDHASIAERDVYPKGSTGTELHAGGGPAGGGFERESAPDKSPIDTAEAEQPQDPRRAGPAA
jgi:hypothetical protein